MGDLLADVRYEFLRSKGLADQAMAQLDEQEFFRRPAEHTNPIAVIVKHLAGNLASRWTDFLTGDGESAGRNRDGEFLLNERDTRSSLLAAWDDGWKALFDTLDRLQESDLDKFVTIRGERHSVPQALLRGLSHEAYHTGQILYLVRLWRPDGTWLTIAPGQSRAARGGYFRDR